MAVESDSAAGDSHTVEIAVAAAAAGVDYILELVRFDAPKELKEAPSDRRDTADVTPHIAYDRHYVSISYL